MIPSLYCGDNLCCKLDTLLWNNHECDDNNVNVNLNCLILLISLISESVKQMLCIPNLSLGQVICEYIHLTIWAS